MGKRRFSALLPAVMGILLILGGLSGLYADSNTVYSLATDADLQSKAVGFTFEGTTWLLRSGDPALTLYDAGGIKGIQILGRDQDWDCIDLRNLETLPKGFDYIIRATGTAVAGAKMKLSQNKGPWGTHTSVDVGSDKTFALEKTFTYDELKKEKAVRIQSEGTTGDFAIASIEVLQIASSSKADEVVIVYNMETDKDFVEKSVGHKFEGSTWIQKSGSPTLTLVDNGSGLKVIRVTTRKQDWDCIDLKNLGSLAKDFDYVIKVTGKTFAGVKMKLSQPASPWGTHVSQNAADDGVFTLEKTFTYNELQKEKAIRIQSEGTTGYFTVETITIGQKPASEESESAPAVAASSNDGITDISGLFVWTTAKGDSWSGANIILGKDAAKWPWSAAGSDGKVAFTPEKNEKYRLTIKYTAKGTAAIRIRWVKDNTNGGYTKADGTVVNSYQYSPDMISTTIPGYFNSGMENDKSYTLVTEFKMDGAEAADGLIGNIAIRGGAGGNDFVINALKIEKIGSPDKVLVNWSE